MTVRTATEPGVSPLPQPRRTPVWGHLSQWVADPLDLVERGARLGCVFELRLWRRAVVGVGPDWNRLVLGDLDRFRSRGSMSQLSPYLAAGVVAMDGPQHGRRRAELNPAFHRRAVTGAYTDRLAEIVAGRLPVGTFDAVEWSASLVREMLTSVFVGPDFPAEVLASFVAPLDREMPAPLLRRPIRLRRMERALTESFREPAAGTLAELFAGLDGGVEEARVSIAAAYDTTAHSLAFALWELAGRPELNEPSATANVVSETLRLYPSGWIGSRVSSTATEFGGYLIPPGRLVIYSPYLTHRSPELWPDPLRFRPERFDDPLPAWGYLPFSAGARTCLGAALATLMLRTAVSAFAGSSLRRASVGASDARPRGGLTLAPRGPVLLDRGPG